MTWLNIDPILSSWSQVAWRRPGNWIGTQFPGLRHNLMFVLLRDSNKFALYQNGDEVPNKSRKTSFKKHQIYFISLLLYSIVWNKTCCCFQSRSETFVFCINFIKWHMHKTVMEQIYKKPITFSVFLNLHRYGTISAVFLWYCKHVSFYRVVGNGKFATGEVIFRKGGCWVTLLDLVLCWTRFIMILIFIQRNSILFNERVMLVILFSNAK